MNTTPRQIAKTRKSEPRKAREQSGQVFADFKKETREIDIVQELIKQDQLTRPNSGIAISDINYYKV